MNYFTKDDFQNEWLGKSSSLGGYYNQCVTLFKEFLKKAGYPNPGRAIGGSGGAREIWHRREALGYGDYFNFEQIGHPGDWFVWDSVYGWYNGVYYGHVAMLIKDNGNGTGQFLGMNQGTNLSPANIQTLSYNGSCGVLHFKGYSHPASNSAVTVYNPSNLVSEHAVATLTVDSVAIREGSPTGKVLKRVNSGYKFEYYYKVVANGHRYVVSQDKTQFMAISNSEVHGKDVWATFSAIEEKKEDVKAPDPVEPKPNYTKNVKGYGIDISEHNKNIDVSKYDFVIIRAAYGEHTDSQFAENVQKCVNANVPFGVYLYDYALNDEQAKAEANYILDLLKNIDVKLGVWFDMEDADHYKQKNGILTKDRCTRSCKIFCDILKEKGYYTGVYTSTSWIGTYVDTEYPLWVANWGTNDGEIQSDQSDKAVMHQYTSTPLDKNVIYHDVGFYASNPVKEEEKKEPSEDIPKKDDSTDKEQINVNGINKIIEMILKIVEKIFKLFK